MFFAIMRSGIPAATFCADHPYRGPIFDANLMPIAKFDETVLCGLTRDIEAHFKGRVVGRLPHTEFVKNRIFRAVAGATPVCSPIVQDDVMKPMTRFRQWHAQKDNPSWVNPVTPNDLP